MHSVSKHNASFGAHHENLGALKMTDMKMQDVKLTDQFAGHLKGMKLQFVHYSGFCRISPSILNRFTPNLQA